MLSFHSVGLSNIFLAAIAIINLLILWLLYRRFMMNK